MFLIILFFVPPGSGGDLPFSETVTMDHFRDQYTLDVTLPVYVKKGNTYEMEDRIISITIDPQGYWEEYNMEDYFSKVLVSIVLADAERRVLKDFESYLNCELKDCDTNAREGGLFWDHAGEERADKAGESFEEETPLIVTDGYIEVRVNLISFLKATYAQCSSLSVVNPCESDADCLLYLWGLTLEVTIDYSPVQQELHTLLEEAATSMTTGDQLFTAGDLDNARTEYEKARTIYEQVGDNLNAGIVQEKIEETDLLRASAYTTLAEEYFDQEQYEKAGEQFEKALTIYDQLGDTGKSSEIKEKINTCNLYQTAAETLKEGMTLFEEAETSELEWRAENKYEKAKSYFEKAKAAFEQLNDSEKVDECTAWINCCDTEIDALAPVKDGEPPRTGLYSIIVVGIIGICVIVSIILKLKPAKAPKAPEEKISKEPDEFKTLKYRLAAGEITVEEYEKLKSTLEE